jgi:hypothetical protein
MVKINIMKAIEELIKVSILVPDFIISKILEQCLERK